MIISKKTSHIIKEVNGEKKCVGILAKYFVLGLPVFRKTIILPNYYGLE